MALRFWLVILFCLTEAALSSVLIVQQAHILRFIEGDKFELFGGPTYVYFSPFKFRIITLQLILQVLVVAGVAFYKSSSILYIVGSVILSVLIWCVLFYLYTGDVFFPIIALANLHWVVLMSMLSWYYFVRILRAF